jgi:hypothetical protein
VVGANCNNGICEAAMPDGAACSEDSDCAGGTCVKTTPPLPGTCGEPILADANTCAGKYVSR